MTVPGGVAGGVGVAVAPGVPVGVGVAEGLGVPVGLGVALGVAVGVTVGVGVVEGVGVAVAVAVGVGVVVGVGVALGVGVGTVIVLVSRVTAPLSARARPSRVAPVFKVMLWLAISVPVKELPVPRTADVPTCQKMFTELPLSRLIMELGSVVSAVPIRKWKAALGSPPVLSERIPVS